MIAKITSPASGSERMLILSDATTLRYKHGVLCWFLILLLMTTELALTAKASGEMSGNHEMHDMGAGTSGAGDQENNVISHSGHDEMGGMGGMMGDHANHHTIPVPGASGSGPFQVITNWATAFHAIYLEAKITVSSVGSGAAQRALWGDIDCENRRIDELCGESNEVLGSAVWGIGDAPFSEHVYSDHENLELQQFPACAGGVLVTHSRDVLTGGLAVARTDAEKSHSLNLGFDCLAGIFNGTIKYWDDPKIKMLNEGMDLPHEPITVVVRADSSGQTDILTSALHHNSPYWPHDATGTSPAWPLDPIKPLAEYTTTCSSSDLFGTTTTHYETDGKEGVALGLLRIPYSIGYMEMGYYSTFSSMVAEAKLSTSDDTSTFRHATVESIRTTMNALSSELDPTTLDVDLASVSVDGGYPASGWAYWYVSRNPDSFESCYQAWLVAKFIEWTYTDPQAEHLASDIGWVPPPRSVVEVALERLNEIRCREEDGTVISARSYVPDPYKEDKNYITSSVRATAWTLGSVILACSVGFMAWVVFSSKTRVVRASQPGFLIMLCIGTLLMGSAIFPLAIDDNIASVRGCDIACGSWPWLLACGFCIIFSALFSKIWRLNTLIRNSRDFKRVKVRAVDVLGPFLCLFTINISLLLAWTIVDPLRWHRVQDGAFNSYGICESDGDAWIYFLAIIVAVNFAALVGATVEAYKARHISMEFSESTFIGFAMICMLQALLLGIPFSFLAGTNPSARLFTYSGIVFIMTMSMLLLMFVPKIMFAAFDTKTSSSSSSARSRDSSVGIKVHMSRMSTEGGEESPEGHVDSNGTGSTASKPSDTAVASNLLHPAGSKHVSFNPQSGASPNGSESHQTRSLSAVAEGSEGAGDATDSEDPEAVADRVPPTSSTERSGKSPLNSAGNVVMGSEKRGKHPRGDPLSVADEEKMMMSSEFMAPSESSFTSNASNIPMIRVEELHPEIANWYFRTHHQNF